MTAFLELRDLTIELQPALGGPPVRAVDRLSLQLHEGEALGLVGGSGSGKTVAAKAILGLLPRPEAKVLRGQIELHGEDLLKASERRLRALRGRKLAMVFQEPMTALNPVLTIGAQITEAAAPERSLSRSERRLLAVELLSQVRIRDPEGTAAKYPHQLSGGMRQRAMIAMALALGPELLIADEPTTALDVTVQAEILALLRELRATRKMALLLITHDFGVVAETCETLAVMRAGSVVETGPLREVLTNPKNEHTRALLAAVRLERKERK